MEEFNPNKSVEHDPHFTIVFGENDEVVAIKPRQKQQPKTDNPHVGLVIEEDGTISKIIQDERSL